MPDGKKACKTHRKYSFEPPSNPGLWYPEGVTKIVAHGCGSFLGLLNEDSCLKYPQQEPSLLPLGEDAYAQWINALVREEQRGAIWVEAHILIELLNHPRIIEYKGAHDEGLVLERAANGSLADHYSGLQYLFSRNQRLKWAVQVTEAVSFIHSKLILHCDIHPGNLLLDDGMNLKLCNFRGRLFYPNGDIFLDGKAVEGVKYFMPRDDAHEANVKTDLFALGSTLFFIMTGMEVFNKLRVDRDARKIELLFRNKLWPYLPNSSAAQVIYKCWEGEFESADHVIQSLKKVYFLPGN